MTSVSPDPHPPTAELAAAHAGAILADLAAGTVTSSTLTRAALDRMAAVDAPGSTMALRAVLAVDPAAMAMADQLDAERAAGALRGSLHGLPVLVKDNIEAIGLPATAGSLALSGRTVVRDAVLVSRLRAAGALVLGATNLSEWANFRSPRSVSGWSAVGGLTGNPWALDRSAGGSSSGSGAAVAAGLASLAVGTETNGSITCPAALNGVVGLKPTVGSVPTIGVVPLSSSQDVPGPLARSVLDAALLYEVLSGRSDCVAACIPESAQRVSVGVATGWLSGDMATDAVFSEALQVLTSVVASIRSVAAPAADADIGNDQVSVLLGEFVDDLNGYLVARPGRGVVNMAEVISFNIDHRAAELGHFGQEYLEMSAASGGRAAESYQQARERNLTWARDVCLEPSLTGGIEVLVAPAYRPAWKSDLTHGDVLSGGGEVCTPAAILGWPLLTVPMGFVNGLPVGLSLVGRAGSEATLLAVGHAFEKALGLVGSGALSPSWALPTRG